MKDEIKPEIRAQRKFNYPIHPLLCNRWSPRAMSGEEMKEEELFHLFEAARWAPSSYNNQPWRFIYALRNTPEWDTHFDFMVEGNKAWTKNASALVVVVSKNTFDRNNNPSKTHSYDAGAAWMSIALEGTHRGFVVHGLEGFNYEKAQSSLEIPDGYTVEAMIAIGRPALIETRPPDMQKKEVPNTRRPLEEITMKGNFKKQQTA